MADLDPAFMQQVFNVPERKWEPHVEHHRQADDLLARFELFERVAFCHAGRVGRRPAGLKLSCSDMAEDWLPFTLRSNEIRSE
ncbi:hypothetical protein [Roseovarius indicus]|uniref:hypothetical protein n=1 Tax=Roseovarius indicus TaxID=540747 RepID=UPI001F3AF658|nr:hypothetical protein [Roseovarius indicus]